MSDYPVVPGLIGIEKVQAERFAKRIEELEARLVKVEAVTHPKDTCSQGRSHQFSGSPGFRKCKRCGLPESEEVES